MTNEEDTLGSMEWNEQSDDDWYRAVMRVRAVAEADWTATSRPARIEVWARADDGDQLERKIMLRQASNAQDYDSGSLFVLVEGASLLGLALGQSAEGVTE